MTSDALKVTVWFHDFDCMASIAKKTLWSNSIGTPYLAVHRMSIFPFTSPLSMRYVTVHGRPSEYSLF